MNTRGLVLAIACLFVLAAVASPVTAEKPDDPGGNGKGNGGNKGSDGGGQSNGGGNGGSGQGSSSSDSGGSGGESKSSSSTSNGEGTQQSKGSSSSSSQASAPSSSGGSSAGQGQGASTPSSSDAGDDRPGNRNGQGGGAGKSDAHGQGPAASDAPGAKGASPRADVQGPPSKDEWAGASDLNAPFIETPSGETTMDSSSSSDGGGSSGIIGFIVDVAESGGSPLKAIKDRADVSELLGTDMDSPLVSTGMVVLTIGTLAGVFGAVRTGTLQRPRLDARAAEEARRHEQAAIAAGLPKNAWEGLEAASYARMQRMDAHTVAFWMGSELAAVRRWQAGRTLEQDLQDGLVGPNQPQEEWSLPRADRSTVRVPDAGRAGVPADDS